MLNTLRRLVDHMRWADERVLRSIEAATIPPGRALEIYAHILAAEHVWLARLRRREPSVPVWPSLSLEECASLATANAQGYVDLLAELDPEDLSTVVSYRNSAGQAFESTVIDMLLQVLTHGSYHRGQVSLLLRQAGAEPNPTDYIAFVRGLPAAVRRA